MRLWCLYDTHTDCYYTCLLFSVCFQIKYSLFFNYSHVVISQEGFILHLYQITKVKPHSQVLPSSEMFTATCLFFGLFFFCSSFSTILSIPLY